MDLLKNENVLIDEVAKLQQMQLDDDVPSIQYFPLSVEMELTSITNPVSYIDHKGFLPTFTAEVDMTAKIESLVEQGQDFVNVLYTFRSVSKAIPEVVIETPEGAGPEEEAEIASKRNEINRKIVDILRPGMQQMIELTSYIGEAVEAFKTCVTFLAMATTDDGNTSEILHHLLIRLLDVLVKLDNLKDMKGSLRNDFSRYKRALGAKLSPENLEEIQLLQSFISSYEIKKEKNYIFNTLRDEIKRIRSHEDILVDILDQAMRYLDEDIYMVPDDKFRLIRVLPHLLLLIDGEADEAKSLNVFNFKKLKLPAIQKVFKKYPVTPLCADMSLTLTYVLERTRHYEPSSMSSQWGDTNATSNPIVTNSYKITSHWREIRDSYSRIMTQLTMTINALKDENTKFKKSLKDAAIADSANEIFSLVLTCFRCLSQWSCIVQSALAWKYRHPVTIAQLKARNIPVDSDGIEYEQVLRYNLSSDELTIMVDVISMIKSLSSSLAQAEALFAPIIRFHIHHAVQQLVQGDLLPLLHRIDKRNKSKQLAILLQIRTLAADWLEGIEPREDYKQYTRRQGQISAFAHPPRVVATSATQLHLLRSYIFSINYEKSSFRSKNGIMGKPDLEKEDVKALEQFNKDSFYFPYMLSFSDTLRCVSDLSDLWYREYFLELTRCIQFPIEMSLPWILIDHILSNRNANGQGMTDGALTSLSSTPMVENVLFLTDMYNDVAHRALYVLNQQFLYDEIESEANLVLDQLIFLLSDEVYSYYKDFISSLALDVTMKKKLEDIKKERYLTIPKKRYEAVLAQRHLHLLGRAINLNFLIGQHINNKLYKDIEVALLRFESSDLSGLTDLKTSLDILKHLHGALAQFIELDSFDSIFNEIDETVSPTTLRGRVTTHIVCSLTLDLIPNFSYNYFTHRFVRSPIPARAIDYGKAPKTAALTSLFGTTCYKAHDSTAKLLCGFFGRPHIEALLYLTGYNDMASIIDECFTILRVKIEDVAAYVDALWEGIMPCKLPKYMFRSSGCYGYFEGKLRTILEYEDLKPEVFQSFREIGNVVAFLKDLSDVLDVADQFQFNAFAPLLGVNPTDSVENVETKTTPLGAIFHDIAAAVGIQIETSNYQSSSMESMSRNAANLTSNSLASQLPVIADTLVNSMSLVMTQKSLIRQTLAKVEEYMDEFKLKITWAVKSEDQLNTAYTAIDIENASGFHRLWSALQFLFCMPPLQSDTFGEEDKNALVADEDEFGHGFAIAGAMFITLLGQRTVYDLMDFTSHILNVSIHDRRLALRNEALGLPPFVPVDADLEKECNQFIAVATSQKILYNELFSYFQSYDGRGGHESYEGDKGLVLHRSKPHRRERKKISLFHPPPDDFEV